MKIPRKIVVGINWRKFMKRLNKAMGRKEPIELICYRTFHTFEDGDNLIVYTLRFAKAQDCDVEITYLKHLSLDFNVGVASERIRQKIGNRSL